MRAHDRRWIWDDARIRRFALCIALALSVSLPLGFMIDGEGKSLLKRGDFPGFYAPAVILARGEPERLYDAELQRRIENEHWPSFAGEFYMSVYPPYLAVLLYPFALLPPLAARLVFAGAALGAYAAALRLAGGYNRALAGLAWAAGISCLLIAPVFVAVFGGQNTPFSMALYAAAICLTARGTRRADLLAGVALGAWLYKPQFGAIALAVPLVRRRYFVLLGALVPGAVYALLGAAVLGPDWPAEWLEAVARFAPRNFVSNRMEMVSVPGLFADLTAGLAAGSAWRAIVSTTGSLALCGLLVLLLVRSVRAPDTATALVAAGPAIALISPQTLFYDMGIPLVSCLFVASLERDSDAWRFLAFALLCGAATILRGELPLTPFPFLAALMLLYVERRLRIRRSGDASTASR